MVLNQNGFNFSNQAFPFNKKPNCHQSCLATVILKNAYFKFFAYDIA